MYPLLFQRKQDIGAGVGGVAQAGASLVDTEMTNQANMQMQQRANTFNAQQAQLNRQFQAGQVTQQEGFQNQQRLASQAYNTQMSNTQMQRRVEDLKASGLNPLLAISQGGASSPTSQAMSGSAAPGSQASAAGVYREQSATGIGPAIQAYNTAAQTALMQAQTRKTGYEGDLLAVDTSPENLLIRSQQIAAQYSVTQETANLIAQNRNTALSVQNLNQANQALLQFKADLAKLDIKGVEATIGTYIQMQNAVNTQQTVEAKNITNVQKNYIGQALAYAQAVHQTLQAGAGSAQAAKGLIGTGIDAAQAVIGE